MVRSMSRTVAVFHLSLLALVWVSAHPDPLENIRIYSYILAESPENSQALLNRGLCYRLVSDYSRAISDFDRAEVLGQSGRVLWMNRAMAHLANHNRTAALNDLNQIINADGADSTALFYRGELNLALGKPIAALRDYSAAIECQPRPHLFFVRSQLHQSQGNQTQALEDLTTAVELAPYVVGYQLKLASAQRESGDLTGARITIDKALSAQPNRYECYVASGIWYASAGQAIEASSEFVRALQLLDEDIFFRPNVPRNLLERARVHELLKDFEAAERDLTRAVILGGTSLATALEKRSNFMSRRGDSTQARLDAVAAETCRAAPLPTATPLPGPTLSLEELSREPTPNLLPMTGWNP